MISAGAKWCPAAASATLSNAAGMVSAYIAQVVLFGMVPKPITLAGAALMLASIVAMALARGPQPRAQDAAPVALPHRAGELREGVPEAEPSVSAQDDDENESLASFIASEFSEYSA